MENRGSRERGWEVRGGVVVRGQKGQERDVMGQGEKQKRAKELEEGEREGSEPQRGLRNRRDKEGHRDTEEHRPNASGHLPGAVCVKGWKVLM